MRVFVCVSACLCVCRSRLGLSCLLVALIVDLLVRPWNDLSHLLWTYIYLLVALIVDLLVRLTGAICRSRLGLSCSLVATYCGLTGATMDDLVL